MKHVQGFTLVEVMIAMAIGLVVVGGVSAVLVSSSSLYRASNNRARVQENSRFALGAMEEDVRMAGFMGCFNLNMYPNKYTNLADTGAGFESDYKTVIFGYESSGSGWTPGLPAGLSGDAHPPLAGSDVIVVRIPTGPSLPLSDAMVTTASPIPLADVSGLEVGGLAVISDCAAANVFRVTQVPATKLVVHANNMNTDARLTRVFSNAGRATVTPIATVAYYIGRASNRVAGNRALFRKDGANPAEEVADGVEQMQLEYGIDTNNPRDNAANQFVPGNQVGANPVVAVKASVLLKSAENNVVRRPQAYTFDGTLVTPTDRYMYTPFTTTIALRNRGD